MTTSVLVQPSNVCTEYDDTIQHVFKMEQAIYKAEEIDWSYVEFVDNQDVLDLIEKVAYCPFAIHSSLNLSSSSTYTFSLHIPVNLW